MKLSAAYVASLVAVACSGSVAGSAEPADASTIDAGGARDARGDAIAASAIDASTSDQRSDLDALEAAAPTSIPALDRAGIGSYNSTGWPFVGNAVVDVDWGQGPFARVVFVVDLDSSCFPFDKWLTHRPPTGQNWPADCDAFDRNFNAYIDDTAPPPVADGGALDAASDEAVESAADSAGDSGADAAADTGADAAADTGADAAADTARADAPMVTASPARTPFEIMHAITPFGGPEHLEIDLTDLANALPGKHRLRVELGSYSDPTGQVTGSNNGWTVSARFDVTRGAAPRRVLAAIPLFAGSLGVGDVPPIVSWDAPAGTVGGRLEYRTSGHGGGPVAPRCVGPAEEFCDRRHQVFVDGAQVEDIEPYRTDCTTLCTMTHYGPADAGFTYCAENPCGALDSVTAPRANWCPGSMTAPYAWDDIPALRMAGRHTFSFQVSTIAQGGNWLASAIYYAYGSDADR